MPEIDLGKIGASVVLNLEGLVSGVAQCTSLIAQLGSDMQANLGSALTGAGTLITAFGAAVVGSLGLAVKAGGDFEQMMQQTAANTTMTTQDIALMNATVRQLGADSAAPLKQLAEGFMHASNFGYSAKDSAVILKEAMKSAVATGGDTGKTTELLAQVMHQFGVATKDAAGTMNVLHLAAANGNMTLEQFVNSAGKSITTARNYGFSLVDVTSALSALTRNGFNAATASTQLTGMMVKITNPAQGAKKALEALSEQTGVNLARDFTVTGAAARGLPGILDDIAEAAKRAHKPIAEVLNAIIPASRGGIGATALTGFARKDFDSIRADAQKAQSGKSDPTGESYAKSQGNLNNQLAQFHNQMTLLAADVQKALMPVLTPLLAWAREAIQWFAALPDSVKQAGIVFLALAGAAAAVVGPLLLLAGSFVTLLPALEAAVPLIAGIGAILTGPVGIAIAGVSALVAGLVVAWQNDWGQIREHTQAFVSWISPYLASAWSGIKSVAESGWNAIKDFLARVWPPIHDIIVYAWEGIVTALRTGMEALQSLFSGTWGNIVAVLRGAWDLIAGVVKTAWAVVAGIITVGLDLLTGRWSKAWEDFKHYAEMAWEGLKQAFTGLMNGIVNIVVGAAKLLYNAGRDLVLGLINGIKSMASSAYNAAKDMAVGTLNAAKDALGIQSPSKEFHDVGENVSVGMGLGIEAGLPHVTRAMGQMVAEHKKAAAQMKKDAKETADALEAAYDHIFEMTHNRPDVEKREAKKQYDDRVKTDPGNAKLKAAAAREYQLRLKEINDELAKSAALDDSGLDKARYEAAASDAKALKEMDAAIAADRKTAEQDDLGLQKAIFDAAMSDRKALAAMDAAIDAQRKEANAEQLKEAVWMLEVQKMDRNPENAHYDPKEKYRKMNEDLKGMLGQMRQNVESILGGAFQKLFEGDSKHFFSSMLQGFTQMLEEMVAKALAAGIINLLTGGAGGFAGGFLSSIGGGGFDNSTNDNHAQRWGFDFARYFTGGMSDYGNKHKPMQGTGNREQGTGDTHVHLNIENVHNHTEADMGKMADMLAWKVQTGLSGRFVGTGR